jgi:hypothetical protein
VPIEEDHSVTWLLKEVETPEQRTLTRSTRAHDTDLLSGRDLQVDSAKDVQAAEPLVQVVDPDDR